MMLISALSVVFVGLLPLVADPPSDDPQVTCGMAPVHGEPVLWYEVAGPVKGVPVVLIHGGQLDRRIWDDQFRLLSSNGFRVVRYDVRGFGRSRMPTHEYSDVEDLRSLLNFLKITKSHLLGLSLGGRIAIDFTLEHPRRVASLTAVGPGLLQFMRENPGPRPPGDTQRAVEQHLKSALMAPAMANPKIAESIKIMAYENERCWRIDPGLNRDWSLRDIDRLPEINRTGTTPILLIIGDRDVPYQQAIVDLLNKRMAQPRLCSIPGAGHMVNMEKCKEFNEEILEFLGTASNSPR